MMSAEFPQDTVRVDAQLEDKAFDESVNLEVLEVGNLKKPQASRLLLICAVVGVLLNIVWTCILVS